MSKEENKGGRPTKYSQDLADSICEMIAMGYSMRSVSADESMPASSTMFKWLREHTEFSEQYARACEERSEAMAEDILDIADDGTNDWMEIEKRGETYTVANNEAIQRSRLRVDTRKWLMAKTKPKKYGDKLDMTSDGKALPTPIYGGLSVKETNEHISATTDKEDI